jgi:hypothetical protein
MFCVFKTTPIVWDGTVLLHVLAAKNGLVLISAGIVLRLGVSRLCNCKLASEGEIAKHELRIITEFQ